MKILFLTSLFPNSSHSINGVFNLSRAKALRSLGHDVKVIAPVGLTPPQKFIFPYPKLGRIWNFVKVRISIPKHEVIEGIVTYHPKWAWFPRRWFWRWEVNLLHLFAGEEISRIVRRFNPEAIITMWIHPFGTYAKYFKKYCRAPVMAIAEGGDILIYPGAYPGWKAIECALNRHCNKVVFVSDAMRVVVNKELSIGSSIVVKNGFDSDLFYLSKRDKKNGEVNLLSVGYFGHVKGHDILLQALVELGDKYNLTLVGDGALRDKYEEFVRDNNLKVMFIGQVSHKSIKIYLDNCDLFCMPSRSESFGIASLEAMACGIPVVATEVGGLSEQIIDGFNGYLCKPESVGALAECIKKASNTDWNYSEIADWAKKTYSWDKWANEIINVIEEEIRAESLE